jgi:hypothetical protein
MSPERQPWFRPKLYGSGVGPPVAWQGWVVVAVYLSGIAASVVLLRGNWRPIAVLLLSAALLLLA